MHLDYLALVARGACVPGAHRTVAIGERVLGRLRSPGHCIDSRLRHTSQGFCEGGLFVCPGALAWEASFRFGTHIVAYSSALKEHRLWMPSWHYPSAFLQLTGISPKRAYTLDWSPDFCDFCPGDTNRLSGYSGQHGLCLWFHTLKAAAEILASNLLEFRCLDPTLRIHKLWNQNWNFDLFDYIHMIFLLWHIPFR